MPVNKDALKRYRIIDRLLSDPNHDYTTDDILTRVNRECDSVSKRMIQKDIKALEEEFGKKVIRNAAGMGTVKYEDQSEPLFYQELTWEEEEILREVLRSIGQFDGLDNFTWLEVLKKKLEMKDETRQIPFISFSKNDGLQNQSVLYYQKGLDGTPEVFLDPNTLSENGTVALNTVTFSKDDRYAAYSVSKSGSDWVEIFVMEVATRKQLADKIEWVKFSGASWGKDGFYYSRYDAPAPGASAYSAKNEYQKVYFHKLGTSQSEDQLVYEDKEHPLRYFSGEVSDDFKWLFIVASEGTSGTEILYKDLTAPGAGFKTLFPGFANDYAIVDCRDDRALVLTNDEAPNFRLVSVDLRAAVPAVEDVIPQSENLLQWVTTAGGSLMAGYLKDASSRVCQYDRSGKLVREITLPGIGTVSR